MSAPDPFELFAYYHLGFDREYRYRFRNLHHTAAYFGLSPDALKAVLHELKLDADTVKLVDFNLSKAHADAQELELIAAPREARELHAQKSFEALKLAIATWNGEPAPDDVDWDNLDLPKRIEEPSS